MRRHLSLAAAACLVPALLVVLRPQHGQAADALRYTVVVAPTGVATLDSAAQNAATLIQLQKSGDISPATLVARARTDATRLDAALHSLGHYAGHTDITIVGKTLDDPTLPDVLDAWPADRAVGVNVAMVPGSVFKLRHIVIQGDAAGQQLDLAPGDPAVAGTVLGAGARLQSALLASGHALARVQPPIADVDAAAEALDVTYPVQAGPRVSIGRITVSGLTDLDESYVRRRLSLQSGTVFDPVKIDAARTDLAKVPAIASVRLNPGTAVDAHGTLPVDVLIAERKLHSVSLTAAYSTDQGGNTTVSWTNRDLFHHAEVLSLSAGLTELGASAARQPGYNVAALLTLPDWQRRDQTLSFTALGVRESLDAYDRTAIIIGTTFARRLSEHWTGSVGLFGERAHFVQDKIGRDYTLVQVPVGLHYDTTDSTTNATTGTRADGVITPTESLGNRNSTFAIIQFSGAKFFDLATPGRSVLALRGLVGTVQGATTFDIPPDQRFYGGGSGTIRGYRFQSVGPRLSGNNKPQGGTSIAAATVEYRQRIGESWGAAVFVDAGEVGSNSQPFSGQLRAGVGVGVRYFTGIGPVRIDIAVPVIHQVRSDPLELYLGLGQAF